MTDIDAIRKTKRFGLVGVKGGLAGCKNGCLSSCGMVEQRDGPYVLSAAYDAKCEELGIARTQREAARDGWLDASRKLAEMTASFDAKCEELAALQKNVSRLESLYSVTAKLAADSHLKANALYVASEHGHNLLTPLGQQVLDDADATRAERDAAVRERDGLREAIREWLPKCGLCGGTALVVGRDYDDRPCPECSGFRALLEGM